MSWLAEKIENMIDGFIDTFIELGQDALEAMGLAQQWVDFWSALSAPLTTLKLYAPLADKLINFTIVGTCFASCIAIIGTLVVFKIVVKLIPTIY